jgi:hypothetical protein
MRHGCLKKIPIHNFSIWWLIEERGNKQFFSLQDGLDTISFTDSLLSHATKYYKELFGPGSGNSFNIDSNLWPEEDAVSEIENDNLISPFSEEEIKSALFHMEKSLRS